VAQTGRLGPGAGVTVVDAGRGSLLADLRELWGCRELLWFLAWRDLRVRYRQTLLGAGWALLEPLLSVLLFTLLFNRLAGIQSGSVPYPLYCCAGLVLWTFFGRALRSNAVSLVANAGLLTKVYFPRLVLPLSGQLATLVDLGCGLMLYLVFLACYGVWPGPALLTMPVWAGLAAVNALGVGLMLAAINVRYRDVSQAVPFITQLWMFASPVAYPLTAVPVAWHRLYLLNPMVGVMEGMRWALLPDYSLDPALLVPSLVIGLLLLAIGLAWFHHTERHFADII